MITWEEALAAILDEVQPLPSVSLPLAKLLGYVLAKPIVATIDSPPFDNSAVDGFAVRLADVAGASADHPVALRMAGEIRAGGIETAPLSAGSALKILTGALVPSSADAVVMKEYCSELNGRVAIEQAPSLGENIRRRGGEFLRGHTVLPAGLLVTPPVVGVLASLGYKEFAVYKRPRAAVVTTGSELTVPGRTLMPGHIYDSNSHSIKASLSALGLDEILMLRAHEDRKDTFCKFKSALAAADVVISTGGVSVGDYDYVKGALEDLGVRSHIWRIAIKPGKPVFFGVRNAGSSHARRKYVFGLPGNPVSALVTFNVFVVPAIAKLMGLPDQQAPVMKVPLKGRLEKKAGRAEFVRAKLTCRDGKYMACAVKGQDSHMLSGLAAANALIVFPLEAQVLEDGQLVDVRPLRFDIGLASLSVT
jgi:molybdopterin molybdotransferase